MNSGIIIGVAAHKENVADVNTLDEVLQQAHKNRTTPDLTPQHHKTKLQID